MNSLAASKRTTRLVIVVVASFFASVAAGQLGQATDTLAVLASPTLPPEGRKAIQDRIDAVHEQFRLTHGGMGPEQFGLQCCQITQIPAPAFARTEHWSFSADGYIDSSNGITLFAAVQLPSGVNISYLDLYYYDVEPSDDIYAELKAFAGGTFFTGPPSTESLATAHSFGDPGFGYASSGLFSYTVNNNVAYTPGAAQLVVLVYTGEVDSGPDVGFKAVDLWWMRQVSPAPTTPTFDDVPASDPAFPFIEALAASGITAGCSVSPPLYCPDTALTRRQMAVFLSKALGLYWPF